MERRSKVYTSQIILHAVIVILLFILLYPLAMTLWDAFKSSDAYINSRWYPTLPLRVSNLSTAWKAVWRYMLNTVMVAIPGTLGCLFVASLGSYAFSLMSFPGKKLLFFMVIGLMMIPSTITMIPSFSVYRGLHLLNTKWALIIPCIVGGSIFGVFLLNSFFRGIPSETFDAAKIDGAGDFKCYYLIALPLSKPILFTLAIMKIVEVWNDYLWPMITIHDHEKLTISAGIVLSFSSQYARNYPVTFSGYIIAALPIIVIFVFANRYYVQGLVGSGIKM